MLKKAGIVVAASTAGILAFAPLAFAGSSDHDSDKHYGKDDKSTTVVKKEDNDVEKGNLDNECEFGNDSGDAEQGILAGSSLLGAVASPITGIVTNATSQLNTLNCTNVNVSDLIDNNSNNETETNEETTVDGSFNTED